MTRSNLVEQCAPHQRGSGYHRYLKQRARRLMRRLRKRDPESAPRKHYFKGYET